MKVSFVRTENLFLNERNLRGTVKLGSREGEGGS